MVASMICSVDLRQKLTITVNMCYASLAAATIIHNAHHYQVTGSYLLRRISPIKLGKGGSPC
jgi:hypothetical protein